MIEFITESFGAELNDMDEEKKVLENEDVKKVSGGKMPEGKVTCPYCGLTYPTGTAHWCIIKPQDTNEN